MIATTLAASWVEETPDEPVFMGDPRARLAILAWLRADSQVFEAEPTPQAGVFNVAVTRVFIEALPTRIPVSIVERDGGGVFQLRTAHAELDLWSW